MEIKQKIKVILDKINAIPIAMKTIKDNEVEEKNLLPLYLELKKMQKEKGFISVFRELLNVEAAERLTILTTKYG